MKLTESVITAKALDLGRDDFTMESGSMTECVSMFVLWDWASVEDSSSSGDDEDQEDKWPSQYYRKVRGFHGSGGFGAINLGSLFAGVPNDHSTKVFVCLGTSSGRNMREHARVKEAAQEWWSETDWSMSIGPEFKVNRLGKLSEV